jgi:poly [ADP-ribose] polymerase
MPHSGGRVGRGIYFASEQGKSAEYVGRAQHKV